LQPLYILDLSMNKIGSRNARLAHYYFPVLITGILVISVSFLTRLLLLIKTAADVHWSFTNIAGIFGMGLLYDFTVASYIIIPMILHLWWMNERIYSPRWKWPVAAIAAGIILLLLLTDLVPKDFNEDLRKILIRYCMFRLGIFVFLALAGHRMRLYWRKAVLVLDIAITCFVLLFNATAEWYFWNEFGVRYNFIAVDYLVYTTEVIGDVWESYPVGWLMAGMGLCSMLLVWMIRRPLTRTIEQPPAFMLRSLAALAFLCLPLAAYWTVNSQFRQFSKNEYVNELAGNGMFEFGTAFRHNELDFFKFYRTLPDSTAFTILHKQLQTPGSRFTSNNVFNIERDITYKEPEKQLNVVLISVESLSADFMHAFGNTGNITPNLDSLAHESIFFTNLYASGTRTVRGLEALSLSIPPTPGQSIVKRPGNEDLFSLGAVFHSKGYTTQYIYGGYSYFDNMAYFFSHNGYKVIDRDALKPAEVHYANIWGVADEDLFSLALHRLDSNYAAARPFFAHIMTVSNHRPFTYPDGRIDIPPSRQVREGAVKYTDYAIGKFIREARQKPWFDHTIFVIVADHCAGSAGSVALPVTGYHIPMLIYSPANISAQVTNRLTAQIDIAPTILGLLKFSYRSKFFGQDVFAVPEDRQRAFISTYQGLGYLKDKRLVIQSPIRTVKEFIPDFANGQATETPLTDSLVQEAIAYYQCASWLIRHKGYGK